MEGVKTRNGLYGFEYLEHDYRRRDDEARPLRWEIKQLWQRSHEIVNLSARGFKNSEIAEILNITPATVSNTLNGKLGQLKLSEIRQDRDQEAKKIAEKIKVLTNKALDVYHEIFDNESGEASLKDRKAAADTVVLELSGLRAPTKVQTQSAHYHLSREEIEEFKQRAIQASLESNSPINVTPEPEAEVSNDTDI